MIDSSVRIIFKKEYLNMIQILDSEQNIFPNFNILFTKQLIS